MNDKTFISRWSRLKSERAAQALETKPNQLDDTLLASQSKLQERTLVESASGDSSIETTPLPHESDADKSNTSESSTEENLELADIPPLSDEDMPPLESLSEESDFSQFFSSGVSDELRNLALRRLFNLPQFNIRDGLNDYDEDFSKMPALAQEVAAKMRSWMHEKQDELTTELTSEEQETLIPKQNEHLSSQENEKQTQETTTPVSNSLTDKEIETLAEIEDDLGDADLEG
ncbi:DUF3306 domain-containing protein [Neptunomonas japonica]|uniref:DUF3306 domain-containing protein n=1 Tax=Neptunomonas japonica TaxID=417574 RepID=UPI0004037357|nr:DUF3306 domain-containing protein [Neptunomonas japonica]